MRAAEPGGAPGADTGRCVECHTEHEGAGDMAPTAQKFCTDCHDNNDWTPGGVAPRGPHASRYAPILERQYLTAEPNGTNASTYSWSLLDKPTGGSRTRISDS